MVATAVGVLNGLNRTRDKGKRGVEGPNLVGTHWAVVTGKKECPAQWDPSGGPIRGFSAKSRAPHVEACAAFCSDNGAESEREGRKWNWTID